LLCQYGTVSVRQPIQVQVGLQVYSQHSSSSQVSLVASSAVAYSRPIRHTCYLQVTQQSTT